MARPLKPLVRGGGFYPSRRWTPLVYPGGYTTANGGWQPGPEPVLKTVSGSIIHITDALAKPAVDVRVAIEPVQSGSGDPSPDNVRPITGWTGVTLTHAGKYNVLIPTNPSLFPMSVNGLTVDYLGRGKYHVYGTASATAESDWIYVEPFTTPATGIMKLNNTSSGSNRKIYFGKSTGSYFDYWDFTTNNRVVTSLGSTANKDLARFYFKLPAGTYDFTFQVEFIEDPDSIETVTVTFPDEPGTVYGGTLDVTTGLLTVTMAEVDLGDLTWRYESGWSAFASSLSDAKRVNSAQDANWVSSIFYLKGAHYSGSQSPDLSVDCNSVAHGEGTLTIKDTEYGSDANAFQTAMVGVQFCYELATPLTYQLTPEEIQLLAGNNNLWADCGDTTLTYYADGNAGDAEALNLLLGGRYTNNHGEDEPTDREALDIILGRDSK